MNTKDFKYRVKTRHVVPSNYVSGHPVRLFGIYLYTQWEVAKEGYPWTCSNCFDVTVFERGKLCDSCIISKAKKLVSSYKLKK